MDVQKKEMKFVMRYAKSILHITQKTKSEERKGAKKELSATILETEKLKPQEYLSRSPAECEIADRILEEAQFCLDKANDSYDFGYVNGLNRAEMLVINYGKERN